MTPLLPLSTATDEELGDLLQRHGAPAWRASQLRTAAWQPLVTSLENLHQLPAPLRRSLGDELVFSTVVVAAETAADRRRTLKLLCRLRDGQTVETVAMESPATQRSRRRSTVCVSTQVGCAVGCPFCATGMMGLRRSCTAAEVVDQVRAAASSLQRTGRGPVTHVVYMGMGEPLAACDTTIGSLQTLTRHAGISPRRITVSTSGVVPGIHRLTETDLPVTLAVSLHAATDALRDRLVPLNRVHPLASLLGAASAHAERTGRRLTLEWCLIDGVNDTSEQAQELRRLALEVRAHVNVIPMNRIAGSPWGPPPLHRTRAFLAALDGVQLTVRDTRGVEGQAACGQLRAALEPRRTVQPDGTLSPARRAVSRPA